MSTRLKNPSRASTLADTKCYKGRAVSIGRGIVARPRVEIGVNDRDFGKRFALRLRDLMDQKSWTSADVANLVTKHGVQIGFRGVDAWLRGQRLPKFKDIEDVALALGFEDYRELLPAPLPKSKRKPG